MEITFLGMVTSIILINEFVFGKQVNFTGICPGKGRCYGGISKNIMTYLLLKKQLPENITI